MSTAEVVAVIVTVFFVVGVAVGVVVVIAISAWRPDRRHRGVAGPSPGDGAAGQVRPENRAHDDPQYREPRDPGQLGDDQPSGWPRNWS